MALKRPATGWKIRRVTTHPGEVLRADFLQPLGMSANALALRLRISAPRLHAILHEKRAVTPDTALRLSRCLGTSPEFWLNLQTMHDLTKAEMETGSRIEREVEPMKSAA
ncbi:MAG: HigA family addiction module antitoxin [Bryocella sp.]